MPEAVEGLSNLETEALAERSRPVLEQIGVADVEAFHEVADIGFGGPAQVGDAQRADVTRIVVVFVGGGDFGAQ
jgi:hypothetical protein